MAVKYDKLLGKVRESDVANDRVNAPENKRDGYLGVSFVASEGRIYFFINGERYYVTGTPAPMDVANFVFEDGQNMVYENSDNFVYQA